MRWCTIPICECTSQQVMAARLGLMVGRLGDQRKCEWVFYTVAAKLVMQKVVRLIH